MLTKAHRSVQSCGAHGGSATQRVSLACPVCTHCIALPTHRIPATSHKRLPYALFVSVTACKHGLDVALVLSDTD